MCYVYVYSIDSPTGVPSSPVLTYKSTLDEILLSWSPVGSDTVCGPVTYNITVMPSHSMIMMINDTVYNITGLYYNTNYAITVLASNNVGDGEPAVITVKTPPGICTNVTGFWKMVPNHTFIIGYIYYCYMNRVTYFRKFYGTVRNS